MRRNAPPDDGRPAGRAGLRRNPASDYRRTGALRRLGRSHRQYRHPDKPGTVTIAGKSGDNLPPGTWASIVKQAGLKK